jgi:hypothetical protein
MLRKTLSMKGKIMFKKITALVATLTLTFVGLTAITGPTQQANAFTSPICGPGSGSAGPVTATTVNYGGKLFDIIGYNKDGNKVGVAGDTNNSVTLLLDKTEAASDVQWNPNGSGNAYAGSTISTIMDTFANSTLSTNEGIIARTLTGGSANQGAEGCNEDWIAGSNVANQKVWALSVDEVSHLILSTRVFSYPWWLRTPGYDYRAGYTESDGGVVAGGVQVVIGSTTDTDYAGEVRPALYLDITSDVFSGITFNAQLPIGACQAEYINPGVDYIDETVTGLDMASQGWKIGTTYAGLGSFVQQAGTATSITDSISSSPSSLVFVKATDDNNHFNSDKDRNNEAQESLATTINIPARPVAPTISATTPSLYGLGDGFVGGLTTNEEYNTTSATYDGVWTNITGTSVDNLSAGDKVCVRTVAEVGVKFKSLGSCVTVGQGVKPAPAKPVKPKSVSTKAKKAVKL